MSDGLLSRKGALAGIGPLPGVLPGAYFAHVPVDNLGRRPFRHVPKGRAMPEGGPSPFAARFHLFTKM